MTHPQRAAAAVRTFLRADSGATAMEYGLILALIAVMIIGALTIIGANIGVTMNTVGRAAVGAT